MIHFDPEDRKGSPGAAAFGSGLDEHGPDLLNDAARRSLDQVADALGVTTALLGRHTASEAAQDAEAATLLEASKLLQAFVTIADPEARQRCLAFVADVAARERQGRG
ncbi:hypothetical protein [Methylobacterium oxalidis]|nr:hypothetical protein [Methylobacterium oxalidis]GJE32982.1 hypothetical protein LDDCCGHA_3181 [Methylobacterium oxalidis]